MSVLTGKGPEEVDLANHPVCHTGKICQMGQGILPQTAEGFLSVLAPAPMMQVPQAPGLFFT